MSGQTGSSRGDDPEVGGGPRVARVSSHHGSSSSLTDLDAFSLKVGGLRAAVDSRVTQARVEVQRRLHNIAVSGEGSTGDDDTHDNGSGSSASGNTRRLPGVPSLTDSFTELARRFDKPMADTVARLTPDDNALLNRVVTGVVSGIKRSSTWSDMPSSSGSGRGGNFLGGDTEEDGHDHNGNVGPGMLPTMWNMAQMPPVPPGPKLTAPGLSSPDSPIISMPVMPEFDIFKSLKFGGSGSGALNRPLGTQRTNVNAGMPRSPFSTPPKEWLNELQSAGEKAVQEWLATARENIRASGEQPTDGGGAGFKFMFGSPIASVNKVKRRANSIDGFLRREGKAAKEGSDGGRSIQGGDAVTPDVTDDEAKRAPPPAEVSVSSVAEQAPSQPLEPPTPPPRRHRQRWARRGMEKQTDSPESNASYGSHSMPTSTSSASLASQADGEDETEESVAGEEGRESPATAGTALKPAQPRQERLDASFDAVSGGGLGGGGTLSARAASSSTASGSRSLREPGRSVAIVTTAALPWMTGTAVNPLLRAAYLARRGLHDVTLVIPWLAPSEQRMIHPGVIFDTPEEQGAYVRQWVRDRCGFEPKMKLDFYPGRYATDKYSIIPVGDVSDYITDSRHDIAVLEEPEHLNWYHSGKRWSDKFQHVVGVVHTNYLEYARREKNGKLLEAAMRVVNSWVSRVHCHKIIKLSDAVQDFPRSETANVHGVSPVFLEVGRRKAEAAAMENAAIYDEELEGVVATSKVGRAVNRVLASLTARHVTSRAAAPAKVPEAVTPSREVFSRGCYFLGKVVWGKGFQELLERVEEHNSSAAGKDFPLEMDVYGSGEDLDAVTKTAHEKKLPLQFCGRADHASDQMHDYKVFVNPSLSDVVATTTAEALAMGKFVIVAQHPSNAFFSTFPNCLVYNSPEEFSMCVKKALSTDPTPLSTNDRYRLSWEAATERFLDAAALGEEQHRGPGTSAGDRLAERVVGALHRSAASVEPMRVAAGAGPNTLRPPDKLDATWNPQPWGRVK